MSDNKIVPLRKPEPPSDDTRMIVTMTVAQLRELISEAMRAATGNGQGGEDRLVDVEEAAKLLSVSPDWLYHNRKTLPFVRKLGRKMLRFSVNAMQKWMESKRA